MGNEEKYIRESIHNDSISGDGEFSQKCHNWFKEKLNCKSSLLTPSCTAALEMAAILIDIKEGDEVIMPSYTFVSTANAFTIRGAKIVFVDIRPDTMNIDEKLIEPAITSKTKAIVVVHYAGVACEMDVVMSVANKHSIFVVEDAAQAMMSSYHGHYLGSIGHFGTFSFHETKNYTSAGEGGLLIINDDSFVPRAEIIRDKGTNRRMFLRGEVDKYSWVDIGSSYLMNDISAAYLWGQLKSESVIYEYRKNIWLRYCSGLKNLFNNGIIELPHIPKGCTHNAHMFYIKVKNNDIRSDLIKFLDINNVNAVFHYVPLHSSKAGIFFGRFNGVDKYTTAESDKLIRLPIYYGLDIKSVDAVVELIDGYFSNSA